MQNGYKKNISCKGPLVYTATVLSDVSSSLGYISRFRTFPSVSDDENIYPAGIPYRRAAVTPPSYRCKCRWYSAVVMSLINLEFVKIDGDNIRFQPFSSGTWRTFRTGDNIRRSSTASLFRFPFNFKSRQRLFVMGLFVALIIATWISRIPYFSAQVTINLQWLMKSETQ